MRTKSDFTKDSDLNIWTIPESTEEFGYQDGAEKKLFQKMLACKDRSTYSEELFPYKTWPEEYHLSPERTNVLRPLHDKLTPGTKVLELGCGCGAITRYLGELGCEVTAVEGSTARAQVAGVRCLDLPNVNVYCSNMQDIDFSHEAFEVITLIGVFEYAALYWKDSQPFDTCLRFVDQHSHSGTTFLLAIENQLGLKYFNGMGEDHGGIKFFGINNLYQSGRKTAQTFTKAKLSQLIRGATRLQNLEFFYPFPDYKLPHVVFTEEAFQNPNLYFHQILSHAKSRDYSPFQHTLFHEPSVYHLLGEEGVAASFANSFIVLASAANVQTRGWLAKIISNRRRLPYCAETTIRDDNGSLVVDKIPFENSESPVSTNLFTFNPQKRQPYIAGEVLSYRWERILLLPRRTAWETLCGEMVQWLIFLKENTNERGNLPADWYDAIPSNIIHDGVAYHLIDTEWQLKSEIPLQMVVTRGILGFFYGWEKSKWVTKVPHRSLKRLMFEIMKLAQIPTNRTLMKSAWESYAAIQGQILPGSTAATHYKAIRKMLQRHLLLERIYYRFLELADKLGPWLFRRLRRLTRTA